MILLDTHVVVWLAFDATRLSKRAIGAIERTRESGEALAISAISFYELAAITKRGRIQLDISLESFLQEIEARFVTKPLNGRISAKAIQLPDSFPKDPMDRIIGATALVEDLPLVTADERIRDSKAVPTIW